METSFQFYDSPIKRSFARGQKLSGQRFNSMIVRLKEVDKEIVSLLKDAFQFYDSPIKRCLSPMKEANTVMVSIL